MRVGDVGDDHRDVARSSGDQAAGGTVEIRVTLPGKAPLQLTEEMRSYEFGWLLWSFGGRSDYAAFANAPEFRTAVLQAA